MYWKETTAATSPRCRMSSTKKRSNNVVAQTRTAGPTSAGKRALELHAHISVLRSRNSAHNRAFDRGYALVGGESRRNRHFQQNVPLRWHSLECHQHAACTYIHGSAEFKYSAT